MTSFTFGFCRFGGERRAQFETVCLLHESEPMTPRAIRRTATLTFTLAACLLSGCGMQTVFVFARAG